MVIEKLEVKCAEMPLAYNRDPKHNPSVRTVT